VSFPLCLDEHIDPDLADLLRRAGDDVMTAGQAGLAAIGVSDEKQLEYAAEHGRVVLTYDASTFRAVAQAWVDSGRSHPDIVFCRRRPLEQLYRRVLLLFEMYHPGDLKNAVIWLPPDRTAGEDIEAGPGR